jgi:hypothetical protein
MKALATGNVRAAFWAVHYSNDESIVILMEQETF